MSRPVGPRTFPLGPVITCARSNGDRLFCTLGDLYDFLGFMTGDVPMAEKNDVEGADSIEEAIERVRPALITAFPELAAVQLPNEDATDQQILDWLKVTSEQYGSVYELTPIGL